MHGRGRYPRLAATVGVALVALLCAACGGDGYAKPSGPRTATSVATVEVLDADGDVLFVYDEHGAIDLDRGLLRVFRMQTIMWMGGPSPQRVSGGTSIS